MDEKKEEIAKEKIEQSDMNPNKELSQVFLEEMAQLFNKSQIETKVTNFEEKLRICIKTLSPFKSIYRYLFNFVSYIERLHEIMAESFKAEV